MGFLSLKQSYSMGQQSLLQVSSVMLPECLLVVNTVPHLPISLLHLTLGCMIKAYQQDQPLE